MKQYYYILSIEEDIDTGIPSDNCGWVIASSKEEAIESCKSEETIAIDAIGPIGNSDSEAEEWISNNGDTIDKFISDNMPEKSKSWADTLCGLLY